MFAEKAYLSGADELASLKGSFMRYDPDGNGYIRSRDVESALAELGRDPSAAVAILREFDPEGEGPVDFEQFIRIAAATLPPPRPPTPGMSAAGVPLHADLAAASAARGGAGAGGSRALAGAPPGGDAGFSSAAVDALLEAPHPAFPGSSELAGGGATSASSALSPVPLAVDREVDYADEGPDRKVEEFLRVLDEYRGKCEREGAYEEAGRATEQLSNIRRQEEARRVKAIRTRHTAERADVLAAHAAQFGDFNAAWERYLAEFDAMAALYVAQMKERHDGRFKEFQDGLHGELMARPVKFSRELLEWRTREATMAKQRKYADAARVKALADELERRERKKLDDERLTLAAAREAKYRQQQAGELAALLKRIEARRAEHVKQREVDSKRLLQRNRNVLAVLDQRHVLEEQRFTASVKASLHPLRTLSPGHKGGSGYGATAARTPGGGGGAGSGSGDMSMLNAAMEAFHMSPSPSGAAGRPPTQTTVGAAGGLSGAGSSRPSTRGYSAAGPGSAGRAGTAGSSSADHGLISKRLGLGSPTGAAGGAASSPGARARAGAAAAASAGTRR